MGNGTQENPYTREDVTRLIEENGDTAKDLDLSGKVFEERIDLREPDLAGIILNEAKLRYANLQRAVLTGAQLKGADLRYANLEGAFLSDVGISSETRLRDAKWGNYILGEEADGSFNLAEDAYRNLKVWHTNAGLYDIAGEFFFREMTAQRKRIEWWPHPVQRKGINWWLHPRPRLWSGFHSFVSGYGERPIRVVRWGALVLFGLSLLYFFLQGIAPYDLSVQAFLGSLYYSAVSFTALGYGPWVTAASVRNWVQGTGAAEAFIGVFTIALFLITFTRKMRR